MDFDLDVGVAHGQHLLGKPLRDVLVHGGASAHQNVCEQVLPDVDIAFLD